MQICLVVDHRDARSGYCNLSLRPVPDEEKMPGCEYGIVPSWHDLSAHVAHGEADEIVVASVLEFVGPDEADRCLEHWVSRLRVGGTLTIAGADLVAVADLLATARLSEADANLVLYGAGRGDWDCKKALRSTRWMMSYMGRCLTIERVTIDGFRYTIVGKRPKPQGA